MYKCMWFWFDLTRSLCERHIGNTKHPWWEPLQHPIYTTSNFCILVYQKVCRCLYVKNINTLQIKSNSRKLSSSILHHLFSSSKKTMNMMYTRWKSSRSPIIEKATYFTMVSQAFIEWKMAKNIKFKFGQFGLLKALARLPFPPFLALTHIGFIENWTPNLLGERGRS